MNIKKDSKLKEKVFWFLNNIEGLLSNILIILLMCLIFMQTVSRYLFGRSFSWAEETSRFAFLFIVYLAASDAIQKGLHIRVTLHIKKLPERIQLILLGITDLLWIIFNTLVIIKGYELLDYMATKPMLSASMNLDMRYIYVILPTAFLLMNIRIIQTWYYYFKNRSREINEGRRES